MATSLGAERPPSDRGIDGIERMRLVRDDIAVRVQELLGQGHGSAGA